MRFVPHSDEYFGTRLKCLARRNSVMFSGRRRAGRPDTALAFLANRLGDLREARVPFPGFVLIFFA
jgi:hypothetical protein